MKTRAFVFAMFAVLFAALPACSQELPPRPVTPAQTTPVKPHAAPEQKDQITPDAQKTPAVPPTILVSPRDIFDMLLGGPRAITPRQLEGVYHEAWGRIARSYYNPDALKDFGGWRNKYDGKLTTPAELDAAIKEMTGSLHDRWTNYTSPSDQMQALNEDLEGKTGLGTLLDRNADGSYRVKVVVFRSPAYYAGLQPGDTVKSIGGTELKGLSQDEVHKLEMAGIGTKVPVVYLDGGKEVPVTLTATETPEATVEARVLAGNVVYLRLPDFEHQQFLYQLQSDASELLKGLKGEPTGLILDLRYNLGGDYEQALSVVASFLEKGQILTAQVRDGRVITEEKPRVIPVQPFQASASPQAARLVDLFLKKPMVVLVNGSTASSSEIVTGALKDNGRARVVGVPTAGKGVGYVEQELINGGTLSVTSLRYLTPNGTDVSVGGIKPDVVVAQPRDNTDKQLDAALSELKKK